MVEKKGADHGIDGRLYFVDGPGAAEHIISSVKSGATITGGKRSHRAINSTASALFLFEESTSQSPGFSSQEAMPVHRGDQRGLGCGSETIGASGQKLNGVRPLDAAGRAGDHAERKQQRRAYPPTIRCPGDDKPRRALASRSRLRGMLNCHFCHGVTSALTTCRERRGDIERFCC